MKQGLLILLAIAALIVVPFLARRGEPVSTAADDTVIIVSPHPESIRYEFGRAFATWYKEQTGRSVYVDFRVIGGTSDIARFLQGEYTNAFRNLWTGKMGREWSVQIEQACLNPRIVPDDTPEDDTPEEAARRAFLASDVTCGMDLFFGGGTYDFSVQASLGTLVNGGLLERFPEWFVETAEPGSLPAGIPRVFAGETYYDAEGRWYGAVLSSYGIIYNRDSLERIGYEGEPRQWIDLTNPAFFGEIGAADPTKSGSMTQAFEMIIQQQMQDLHRKLTTEAGGSTAEIEARAVEEGWMRGMQIIQLISANARYFSDSSQKPNIDVGMGDCAAGMSIDFYARFQQQNIQDRSGDTRFGFHSPTGGTTVSADPVGLLRGAPNEEVARRFLEFVLSLEGQKLWNFKPGTPGGPEVFAIRRSPIRPELYEERFLEYRSDPEVNPFLDVGTFVYRGNWTGRLFSEIRTIVRIAFMDVRDELVDAWAAILQARAEGRTHSADKAYAVMSDLSRIDHTEASTTIDAALKAPAIEGVTLARDLSRHFRDQYQRAQRIAEGGK